MNAYQERFRGIIEQYIEELEKADRNRKPGSGLFGIGQGPGDYPCHEAMDRQVAELAAEAAEADASPEETVGLVNAILRAEQDRKWPEYARWAVLASQRHTLPLIPRLESGNREEILAWYVKAYPKRRRVPIQKQIIRELEEK